MNFQVVVGVGGIQIKSIKYVWAVNGLKVKMEGESVGMRLGRSDVCCVPEAT